MQFSFSLGSDVTKATATIPGGVSDGEWHTVTASYFNRVSIVKLIEIIQILMSSSFKILIGSVFSLK